MDPDPRDRDAQEDAIKMEEVRPPQRGLEGDPDVDEPLIEPNDDESGDDL